MTASIKLNGFWPKAGPILLGVLMLIGGSLLTVTIDLARDLAKDLADLLRVYEVHLEKPHAGVEKRLKAVEAFHEPGERFTAAEGDRLAEILEEAIVACETDDRAALRRSLSDIRAFRREP